MGGASFAVYAEGYDLEATFDRAHREAAHEYGHRGYTGTLAEKMTVVEVVTRVGQLSLEEAMAKADELNGDGNSPVDDKWGPAGALAVYDEKTRVGWVFFGWASC